MSERRRMALEDLSWIYTEYRLRCRIYGLSQTLGLSHGLRMYPTFAETMDRNCLDLYERQAKVRRLA
jgi:hypothetical protein